MCILGSLDVRNEPEVATKSGDGTEAGERKPSFAKQSNLEEMGC